MENSLLAIFTKIWPQTLYYSTGTLGAGKKLSAIPKFCGKP